MTITEIASMAGVSIAAVSRYLNDGYVAEDKRERIRKAIEETGYVPSVQAQTMRTKKTNIIGVILPKIDSESVSRITSGISEKLGEEGYQMLLADTRNDPQKELDYLKTFTNNHVDGIIFLATQLLPAHRELLETIQIPVVLVGQHVSNLSCIYHNDREAARQLTLKLLNGKKRPAYIGVTMKDEACGRQRLMGFKEALSEKQIAFDESLLSIGEFSIESGYESAKQLFTQHQDIDAIFCATDTIALGVFQYLQDAGIQIPAEVAICGVGHARLSELIYPKLTTAHYYYKTAGLEAAKILFELLKNKNMPQKQLELGFRIIQNESTLS